MRTLLALALLIIVALAPALAQRGGMRFNQDNVPGWTLMTVDERNAHRAALQHLKTYEECKAYMQKFRARIEERARAQGKTLREPRRFVCDELRARGQFK
jgi:hypothetical protein